MNVLAIGAHPDDIDFCCGGTLIRCAERGDKVTMCIVTDGRGHPVGDPAAVAARRRAEAEQSAAVLGGQLRWLGIPDGAVVDDLETRRKFIQLMVNVQPDLIITHSPSDYHSDHNMTSQLVTATVQMAWAPPPGVTGSPLRKQVPVAFMCTSNAINFLPEEYVDVSAVWDRKVQMVLNHKSQYLRGPNHDEPVSPGGESSFYRLARVVDEFYGLACWVKYAEGFRWWRASDRLVTRRLLP